MMTWICLKPPLALDTLCEMFHLSRFERDILLLCAAIELDSSFGPLCAAAHGDAHLNYPTFSLALAALPDAVWSALSPGSPLRYWRLIEIEASRSLTQVPCVLTSVSFITSLASHIWTNSYPACFAQ